MIGATDRMMDAVGGIYDTVLHPEKLTDALLGIGRCTGADLVHLVNWHAESSSVVNAATSLSDFEDASNGYTSYYGAIDPRRIVLQQTPLDTFYRCHQHFGEAAVRRSEFFQDYLLRIGLRWVSATRFQTGDGTDSLLAFAGASGRLPLDDSAIERARQLVPHLKRAALLRDGLARHAGNNLDADKLTQALPMACLLLNSQGECLTHNARFAVAMNDLKLKLAGRFLAFSLPVGQARWVQGIKQLNTTGLAQSLVFSALSGSAWTIHMTPLRALIGGRDGFEALLILAVFQMHSPSRQAAVERFRRLHGLTPAEADVLMLLCDGRPLSEVARERSSTLNTVRRQLARIYQRSGYHSQRELIVAVQTSGRHDFQV